MKNIMVFKTDIVYKSDLLKIQPLLEDDTLCISRWTVDRGDIDHVLRVETFLSQPAAIIDLLHSAGYACEELTD